MSDTLTVIFGIVAILFPMLVGRLVWKRFDGWFGRNDQTYMNSLEFFLKKLGCTVLVAFILLWLGMSLVFSGNSVST
jgi:hypothetical protein